MRANTITRNSGKATHLTRRGRLRSPIVTSCQDELQLIADRQETIEWPRRSAIERMRDLPSRPLHGTTEAARRLP